LVLSASLSGQKLNSDKSSMRCLQRLRAEFYLFFFPFIHTLCKGLVVILM
jgi:hypothetical protein